MKTYILLLAAFMATLGSCVKTANPPKSVQSSSADDARKKQPLEISFYLFTFSSLMKALLQSGDVVLGTGFLEWDSCQYTNPKPSKGKIFIDGVYYYGDGRDSFWTMEIEEHRSKARITEIGDPYYVDYYEDYEWKGQLGPFRDTFYEGTGSWKILSSTHPLIKDAGGKLTFNTKVWYGVFNPAKNEFPDSADIERWEFPADQVLDGSYK